MPTGPRYDVDFTGIAAHFTTFKGDASLPYDRTQPNGTPHVNKAVKVVADDTVGLATDATRVLGRVERVEADGKVVVQDGGYALMLRDASTALLVDSPVVGALSGGNPGYIRAGLVTEPGRGVAVRTATATAVVVMI